VKLTVLSDLAALAVSDKTMREGQQPKWLVRKAPNVKVFHRECRTIAEKFTDSHFSLPASTGLRLHARRSALWGVRKP